MAKKKQHGGKRPGSGRPVSPDGRTITVTVTVPESVVHGLKAFAKQEGWSKSKAVTEALREYLTRRGRK